MPQQQITTISRSLFFSSPSLATMSASIINIANDKDATSASLLDSPTNGSGSKSILFFWAEWHAPSNSGGPFDTVVKTLAQQNDGSVKFYRVLAEEAPKLSRKHNVNTVPTFLFMIDGTVVDRIDGGDDVAAITQYYSKLVSAVSSTSSSQNQSQPTQQSQEEPKASQTPEQSINTRLQSLVASSPIILFQKGTPNAPRCGFSRQAIELLTASNVSFGYFDILEDDDVRQGLKSYSDWPTYPQLYVRGELVGGLDIMKELMEEDGGLVEQLELGDFVIKNGSDIVIVDAAEEQRSKDEKKEELALNDKLKQVINRHRIMIFMKGIPSGPKCGFSRQIVEILDSFNVSYDAFNILEDEEVRQGLKVYSDWPTFPQLYVEGDLVGGLDIVQEMMESGDLEDMLKGNSSD